MEKYFSASFSGRGNGSDEREQRKPAGVGRRRSYEEESASETGVSANTLYIDVSEFRDVPDGLLQPPLENYHSPRERKGNPHSSSQEGLELEYGMTPSSSCIEDVSTHRVRARPSSPSSSSSSSSSSTSSSSSSSSTECQIVTREKVVYIEGPRGERGPEGAVGPAGQQGREGPAGPQGKQGPIGPQGEPGPLGPTGPEGPTGCKGPRGHCGTPGTPGEQGNQGPRGKPGPCGPAGPAGPAGPEGIQGPAGPTGPRGPRGDLGPTGPAGPQGRDGPAGAVGLKGDTGNEGPAGPTGPQGLDGPTGPRGPQGPQGPPCNACSSYDKTLRTVRYIQNGGTHNVQNDDSIIVINSSNSVTLILPESAKWEQDDDYYQEVRPLTISSPIGSHVVKGSNSDTKINSYLTSVAIGPRKSGNGDVIYGPGNTTLTFYPDGSGGWLSV